MSLVEQELLTLPEHLCSPPVFSGSCVTRSIDLCVFFSFSNCVVCSASTYGFWLHLSYLQACIIYMFCRSLFVLLYFFLFCHCVVCPSSISDYPLWYLQTLLRYTCIMDIFLLLLQIPYLPLDKFIHLRGNW